MRHTRPVHLRPWWLPLFAAAGCMAPIDDATTSRAVQPLGGVGEPLLLGWIFPEAFRRRENLQPALDRRKGRGLHRHNVGFRQFARQPRIKMSGRHFGRAQRGRGIGIGGVVIGGRRVEEGL